MLLSRAKCSVRLGACLSNSNQPSRLLTEHAPEVTVTEVKREPDTCRGCMLPDTTAESRERLMLLLSAGGAIKGVRGEHSRSKWCSSA